MKPIPGFVWDEEKQKYFSLSRPFSLVHRESIRDESNKRSKIDKTDAIPFFYDAHQLSSSTFHLLRLRKNLPNGSINSFPFFFHRHDFRDHHFRGFCSQFPVTCMSNSSSLRMPLRISCLKLSSHLDLLSLKNAALQKATTSAQNTSLVRTISTADRSSDYMQPEASSRRSRIMNAEHNRSNSGSFESELRNLAVCMDYRSVGNFPQFPVLYSVHAADRQIVLSRCFGTNMFENEFRYPVSGTVSMIRSYGNLFGVSTFAEGANAGNFFVSNYDVYSDDQNPILRHCLKLNQEDIIDFDVDANNDVCATIGNTFVSLTLSNQRVIKKFKLENKLTKGTCIYRIAPNLYLTGHKNCSLLIWDVRCQMPCSISTDLEKHVSDVGSASEPSSVISLATQRKSNSDSYFTVATSHADHNLYLRDTRLFSSYSQCKQRSNNVKYNSVPSSQRGSIIMKYQSLAGQKNSKITPSSCDSYFCLKAQLKHCKEPFGYNRRTIDDANHVLFYDFRSPRPTRVINIPIDIRTSVHDALSPIDTTHPGLDLDSTFVTGSLDGSYVLIS